MRKIYFAVLLLITLAISSCNEKNLINQLVGTWHVQRYLVSGADRTGWFDSTYAGYTWYIYNGNKYLQNWSYVTTYTLWHLDTISHYDTTAHAFVIDSVLASNAVVPTSVYASVSGQWYLTNGNQWIETRDSANGDILYQILDQSSGSLHLMYGNKEYYLGH